MSRVIFRYVPTPPPGRGRRIVVRRQGPMAAEAFKRYKDAVAGLRFDAVSKQFIATLDKLPNILQKLREAHIGTWIAPELSGMLEKHEASTWLDLQTAKSRLLLLDEELKKKGKALYPYQRIGTEWLATRYRALLADEQGLGKTIQALCAIPPNAPVLVICPAVAKGVWIREASMWRPNLSPQALEGRESFRFPRQGELIITNFDILPRTHKPECPRKTVVECDGCSDVYPEAHADGCKRGVTYCPGCVDLPAPAEGTVMIVDEAHDARNPKSLRGEAVRTLAAAVRNVSGRSWYCTGTPLLNTPEELWALLESCDLAHEAFGSFRAFAECLGGTPKTIKKFDRATRTSSTKRVGYDWSVASMTPEQRVEVSDRLQRVMLRRMVRDVLKDLPEMTKRLHPVDVSKQALKELDRYLKELGGLTKVSEILSKRKIPFELVSTVRSALAKAKIPAMLEYVEQYESNKEPLVVFSAHRAPIDLFLEREGWAVITGDTPSTKRTEIEDDFQKGRYLGLAGTIEAAGVGITLTYASHGLFLDQEWTPALNDQAGSRLLRLGQKRPVFIDIFVANHPIDIRVAEILNEKKGIILHTIDAAREAG